MFRSVCTRTCFNCGKPTNNNTDACTLCTEALRYLAERRTEAARRVSPFTRKALAGQLVAKATPANECAL